MKLHTVSVLSYILAIYAYAYVGSNPCINMSSYLDSSLQPGIIPVTQENSSYNSQPATVSTTPYAQYSKYPETAYNYTPTTTDTTKKLGSLVDLTALAGSLNNLISYYTPPNCNSTNTCINFGSGKTPGNNTYANPCANSSDKKGYQSCITNSVNSLKSTINNCRKILGDVEECCAQDSCLEMLKTPEEKPVKIDDASIKKISDAIVKNGIIDKLIEKIQQIIQQNDCNKNKYTPPQNNQYQPPQTTNRSYNKPQQCSPVTVKKRCTTQQPQVTC